MKFLKKYVDPWLRLYSILPLLSAFLFNDLIYWGSMVLAKNRYHYDFTTELDRMVPLVPWTIIIYLGCYIFWIVNYIIIGHLEKKEFYRFITADLLSRFLCGVFFLLLPTTNVRPPLPADSIFTGAIQWLWSIDAPVNLFPSIHCLVSWLCYVGIRGKKGIPKWYQWLSCGIALAVCVSTQTTKQHYFVDVIGAIVIAEGCYWLTHHTEWYRAVMKVFEPRNADQKRKLEKTDG
ncbi:MAG: phosphatase PAP2 family protein [Lachnospiraceae bacterium]|nr:phosphatase PAP2 family protein [Lachnospiraceae bacterium]MDD3796154.1 phosphatase PAP2 family protein [Lachnospiraceae bacterium]